MLPGSASSLLLYSDSSVLPQQQAELEVDRVLLGPGAPDNARDYGVSAAAESGGAAAALADYTVHACGVAG